MKTLVVRLPEGLASQIEQESRRRRISKSDVVRERLARHETTERPSRSSLDSIRDLIGSVDGLPSDLSSRKKAYLKASLYGRKRRR